MEQANLHEGVQGTTLVNVSDVRMRFSLVRGDLWVAAAHPPNP